MTTHNNQYQNFSLQAEINDGCEKIKQQVKIGAEDTATRMLPHPTGDHLGSYFEEYHLSHQLLLDKINAELQFESICDTAHTHREAGALEKHALIIKLSEAKQKRIDLNEQAAKTKLPENAKRYTKARIASGIICLFEGIFSIPVFESWGMNLIESAILGLLLAGVLATFAKMFPKILGLGKTLWQRRLIVLLLFLLTITMFTYMAGVRADFLNSGDARELGLHYSPAPFICISEFLLFITVCVSYFYRLTREQKQALFDYEKLQAERKANTEEISGLQQAITEVQSKIDAVTSECGSMLVFGSMLEDIVVNNARSCYALYKKYNLMHRLDQQKPDCFDQPYPFSFNTKFHSIKSLHHENK